MLYVASKAGMLGVVGMVEQAAAGSYAFADRQTISAEAKGNRRLLHWSRINHKWSALESESMKGNNGEGIKRGKGKVER